MIPKNRKRYSPGMPTRMFRANLRALRSGWFLPPRSCWVSSFSRRLPTNCLPAKTVQERRQQTSKLTATGFIRQIVPYLLLEVRMKISVTVNGTRYERDVEPRMLLVHFLREEIGLTGTNIGCDTSQCGACPVHMDGRALKSCTCLAVPAHTRETMTT